MHSNDHVRIRRRRLAGLAGVLTLSALSTAAFVAACSLTDVKRDPCTTDAQCAAAFGAGSKCSGGYCSAPGGAGPDSGACSGTNPDGTPCACNPMTTSDFENACTSVTCVPFDDATRVTKLLPDGGLPPLP